MLKKLLVPLVAVASMGVGVWAFQSAQYDFETLEGDKYAWSEFEGQWVVVNYFAEWCAPCLKEIPELNGFAQFAEQNEHVSLFAVSYDALSKDELTALKQRYNMSFALIDSQAPKMLNERPKSLPATFIITPDGNVAKQLLGEQTNEKLQQVIEALNQAS